MNRHHCVHFQEREVGTSIVVQPVTLVPYMGLVCILAAPVPTQLSANESGKAIKIGPSAWALASTRKTQMKLLDWPGPTLLAVAIIYLRQ